MRKIKYIFSAFLVFVLCMASSLSSFATEAPSSSMPVIYWPFASLPTGYFDGDINAVDSGYSISFSGSSNGSSSSDVDLESESSGVDRYSISVPASTSTISGSTYVWQWSDGSLQFEYDSAADGYIAPGGYYPPLADGSVPSGTIQTPNTNITNGSYTETVVQTASANEDITGDIDTTYLINSSFAGYISPNSDNTNHRRYRAFWFTRSSGGSDYYVYVISDARNRITVNQTFANANGLSFRFWFAGGYDLYYFALDSSGVPASLSWEVGSSGSAAYFGCYSQKWSFSSDSPYVRDLNPSSVTNRFLTTSVFGEVAQTHYLLGRLHSDLTSLQSSITSSISNQTNTLVNTNTPGNFDQTSMGSTDSLLTLESSLHAPNTNNIFSTGNTFTDGMGFWRDRMNELLFPSNSPITALTVFSLTLGLAVLVIGRRVSGGGKA